MLVVDFVRFKGGFLTKKMKALYHTIHFTLKIVEIETLC
jgi:hypothetical protein